MLFVWNSLFVCLRLWCLFACVCFLREYRDCALVELSSVEIDHTVCECIESVVLTLGNIYTGIVSVTTLANDNVACDNLLTTTDLNT